MKLKTLLITMFCGVSAVAGAQTSYTFNNATAEQRAELDAGLADGTWLKDADVYKTTYRVGKNSASGVVVDHTNIATFGEPLKNNTTELSLTKGLLFGIYVASSKSFKGAYPASTEPKVTRIGFDIDNTQEFKKSLLLNGGNLAIVIPNLTKGMKVGASYRSTSSTTPRWLDGYNLDAGHTFGTNSDGTQTYAAEGTVSEDGAVWLVSTNGLYVYDITIKNADGTVVTTYISNVEAAGAQDGKIYDLNGRFVGTDAAALQPGVYVQNGKKFVKQ